jgi:hypothetical protein
LPLTQPLLACETLRVAVSLRFALTENHALPFLGILLNSASLIYALAIHLKYFV